MIKFVHSACLAAAALGFAASAMAADAEKVDGRLFGVLETAQGSTWVSGDTGDVDPSQTDYYASEYAMRLGISMSEAVLMQADVDFDYGSTASKSVGSDDNLEDSMQLGAHLAHVAPSAKLMGLFGGLGRSRSDSDTRSDFWFAGAEIQIASTPMAPYLQLGFLDGKPASGEANNQFRDAFFLRGVTRHSLNESALIQLEAAYANGVADTDEDRTHILEWGARIEWSLTENLPVFLAYRGTSFQNPDSSADSGDDKFIEQSVYVGLTYHFGSAATSQAQLDLPAFGRWVAAGEVLD